APVAGVDGGDARRRQRRRLRCVRRAGVASAAGGPAVTAGSRLASLASTVPTYPEVGATRAALLGDDPFGRTGGARAPLPAGYRHLRLRRRVGRGAADFHAAAAMLHSWR